MVLENKPVALPAYQNQQVVSNTIIWMTKARPVVLSGLCLTLDLG